MKWYSVKKYKPPSTDWVIARGRMDDDTFYNMARYYEDEDIWGFGLEDENENMIVTHFCIPDPIEIKNEHYCCYMHWRSIELVIKTYPDTRRHVLFRT